MPRQDAQGRWISDDGLFYWDGATWRPLGGQPPVATGLPPPAQGKSAWPAILIGCGIALVVVVVLGIVGLFVAVSNPDFQRTVCNAYVSSNQTEPCPFSLSSP